MISLKQFKDSIKLLLQEMKEFKVCIQDEYKAVLDHNLSALEIATQRKQKLSQVIAHHLENLKTYDHSLSGIFKKFVDSKDPQAMKRLEAQTLQALEEFKVEVAKNHFTIDRLLFNHQESFRFWCEIATEEASSYDKKGAKTSQATLAPQFEAKI